MNRMKTYDIGVWKYRNGPEPALKEPSQRLKASCENRERTKISSEI